MNRLLTALVAGAAVSTLAYASAASLSVNGNTIQAGVDTDVRCDTNGVGVDWGLETDDNTVRNVKVNDIATACAGATMFVSVNNGPTMSKVIASTTESFSFTSPYPSPESIENIKVWIEG